MQVKPLFNEGCYWGADSRPQWAAAPRAFALKRHFALFLAVFAILATMLGGEARLSAQYAGSNAIATPERQRPELGLEGIATPPFRVLEDARRSDKLGQVQIRQRVVIRISPSPPDARERLMSTLPRRPMRTTFEEVPHGECVTTDDIVGVQPTTDNRLLLFLENRQILAASLEHSCTARAFYQGFYVERSEDGQICISRDRLQSRAGLSCSVEELTRLVAVGS
jgi:hypothetical protein